MRSAYTENRLKEIRKEKGIPELNDLQWFWSGKYWYVTFREGYRPIVLKGKLPVGSGKNKGQAYEDFKSLLMTKIAENKAHTKDNGE